MRGPRMRRPLSVRGGLGMPTASEYSLLASAGSMEPHEYSGLVATFDRSTTQLAALAAASTSDATNETNLKVAAQTVVSVWSALAGRTIPPAALATWYANKVSALITQSTRLDVLVREANNMRPPARLA